MTREEAIEMIASMGKYMSSGNPIWKTEPVKKATDMAIEALKEKNRSDSLVRDDAENCKESESKLDLISRQDAIKTVIRMCSPICDWELEKQAYTDCVVAEINSLPSADITETEICQRCQDLTDTILNRQGDEIKRLKAEARPTGEWIFNTSTSNGKSWNVCSECGESMFHPANFCPSCGADMRGGKDDER